MDEYDKQLIEWGDFFKCKSVEDLDCLEASTTNPGIKAAIAELRDANKKRSLFSRLKSKFKRCK